MVFLPDGVKNTVATCGRRLLTTPKGGNMSVRPAQVDEILPEGTEIEVDAIDASELPPFKATSVFGDVEPIGSIPLRPIRRR